MEYTYGTEEFMSPEIALGLAFGIESDIFSFGILLCEMITGMEFFHLNCKLSSNRIMQCICV